MLVNHWSANGHIDQALVLNEEGMENDIATETLENLPERYQFSECMYLVPNILQSNLHSNIISEDVASICTRSRLCSMHTKHKQSKPSIYLTAAYIYRYNKRSSSPRHVQHVLSCSSSGNVVLPSLMAHFINFNYYFSHRLWWVSQSSLEHRTVWQSIRISVRKA